MKCSRRRQQRHSRFIRSAVAFALIAWTASGAEVIRLSSSAARARKNVIQRQFKSTEPVTAVLAAVTIAHQYPRAFAGGTTLTRANIYILDQANNGGDSK